jgi:hypothetical protein
MHGLECSTNAKVAVNSSGFGGIDATKIVAITACCVRLLAIIYSKIGVKIR